MGNSDLVIFAVGCAVFAVALTSTFMSLIVSNKSAEHAEWVLLLNRVMCRERDDENPHRRQRLEPKLRTAGRWN